MQRPIDAGIVVDAPEAWKPAGKASQMTFHKNSIKEGTCGPGATHIDTFFTNHSAFAAVTKVEFLLRAGR